MFSWTVLMGMGEEGTRLDRRKMVSSMDTSVRRSKPRALRLGRCRNTAAHSHPM